MEALQKLMNDIQEWGKVFGDRPVSVEARQLEKEAKELKSAIDSYQDSEEVIEEFADCMICILHAAARYGLSAEQLIVNTEHKMIKNKARKWGNKLDDGTYHHV